MRKYNGNTGRYEYIPDQRLALDPARYERSAERGAPLGNRGASNPVGDADPASLRHSTQPGDLLGGLQKTLSNLVSRGFENEDLLLFAVLFLMYQETHDKELLIIMGGMFLL